jgi:hypothetical protein
MTPGASGASPVVDDPALPHASGTTQAKSAAANAARRVSGRDLIFIALTREMLVCRRLLTDGAIYRVVLTASVFRSSRSSWLDDRGDRAVLDGVPARHGLPGTNDDLAREGAGDAGADRDAVAAHVDRRLDEDERA